MAVSYENGWGFEWWLPTDPKSKEGRFQFCPYTLWGFTDDDEKWRLVVKMLNDPLLTPGPANSHCGSCGGKRNDVEFRTY